MQTFTMVGATFRPASAKDIIKSMNPGDSVTLEADPDNEYDDTAVMVMAQGEHIGFVPKGSNADLFTRLINGESITAECIAFESTLKPIFEAE